MTDEEMEQECITYLWEILIGYGLDPSFVIGTLNSLKTPLHKAMLLRFLEMSTEYNLIPTKQQLSLAVEKILLYKEV